MKEIWKDIKGYEGLYQVSNLGRVKSLERKFKLKRYIKTIPERTMKQTLNPKGYMYVSLCKNGKYKWFRVHRLVAQTFIKNPNNYEIVNHKDFNKLNNSVDNLEWCTSEYNLAYSKQNMKKKHNVKTNTGQKHIIYRKETDRYRFTLNHKDIKIFKTLVEAINYRDEYLKRIEIEEI